MDRDVEGVRQPVVAEKVEHLFWKAVKIPGTVVVEEAAQKGFGRSLKARPIQAKPSTHLLHQSKDGLPERAGPFSHPTFVDDGSVAGQ